jgi:hypothetical protein
MTTIKSILRRSGLLVHGEAAGREVDDELRFHIELRTRDNIAAGMSPEDAVADAKRRFGDFDQIRAICEEIRKERQASFMKLAKGLLWITLWIGVALQMGAQLAQMRLMGQFLTIIAVLWLLLIYLRQRRPDQSRIIAIEQPALSVIHAIGNTSPGDSTEDLPRPVIAYDKDGRTPVERLRSDEE